MGGKGAALRLRQGNFSGLSPGDPAHCCIFGHATWALLAILYADNNKERSFAG
jgi:hypothetical protein